MEKGATAILHTESEYVKESHYSDYETLDNNNKKKVTVLLT